MSQTELRRAAEAIRSADALLIGAGAGMGVDSGLPDFRSNEGFWKVFTSNMDGQFQKAGFPEDRILEVHGSIHFVQCLSGSCPDITSATPYSVEVDPETFRARPPLPTCPTCGSLLRPNILMFGDWGWDETRASEQRQRLTRWLEAVQPGKLAIVECGARTAIPSVRRFCEFAAVDPRGTLIRINVREPQVPAGGISLPLKALEALKGISEELERT